MPANKESSITGGKLHLPSSVVSCVLFLWNMFRRLDAIFCLSDCGLSQYNLYSHSGRRWRPSAETCSTRTRRRRRRKKVEEEEEDDEGDDEEGQDCGAVCEGWYIPRPALCRDHTTCSSSTGSSHIRHQQPHSSATMHAVAEWLSPTPSSNTSTQSGSSGSLLLTAANLAALRLEPPGGKEGCAGAKEDCAGSVASSTHFTMVNYGIHRTKEPKQSCCAKHHVTTLVVTTCSLFLVGLIVAVYYIDMRSRSVQYS